MPAASTLEDLSWPDSQYPSPSTRSICSPDDLCVGVLTVLKYGENAEEKRVPRLMVLDSIAEPASGAGAGNLQQIANSSPERTRPSEFPISGFLDHTGSGRYVYRIDRRDVQNVFLSSTFHFGAGFAKSPQIGSIVVVRLDDGTRGLAVVASYLKSRGKYEIIFFDDEGFLSLRDRLVLELPNDFVALVQPSCGETAVRPGWVPLLSSNASMSVVKGTFWYCVHDISKDQPSEGMIEPYHFASSPDPQFLGSEEHTSAASSDSCDTSAAEEELLYKPSQPVWKHKKRTIQETDDTDLPHKCDIDQPLSGGPSHQHRAVRPKLGSEQGMKKAEVTAQVEPERAPGAGGIEDSRRKNDHHKLNSGTTNFSKLDGKSGVKSKSVDVVGQKTASQQRTKIKVKTGKQSPSAGHKTGNLQDQRIKVKTRDEPKAKTVQRPPDWVPKVKEKVEVRTQSEGNAWWDASVIDRTEDKKRPGFWNIRVVYDGFEEQSWSKEWLTCNANGKHNCRPRAIQLSGKNEAEVGLKVVAYTRIKIGGVHVWQWHDAVIENKSKRATGKGGGSGKYGLTVRYDPPIVIKEEDQPDRIITKRFVDDLKDLRKRQDHIRVGPQC